MKSVCVLSVSLLLGGAIGITATEPNAATRRWWSHVEALANDDMHGRDTGTAEHRRAQEYVVRHLERHGVRPAGERSFYQAVPLRGMHLQPASSEAVLSRGGRDQPLRWLHHLTVAPITGLPAVIAGDLVFAGSDNGSSVDTAGKMWCA
jgi:hypothetical protein